MKKTKTKKTEILHDNFIWICVYICTSVYMYTYIYVDVHTYLMNEITASAL